MSAKLISRINFTFQRFENALISIITGRKFPPEEHSLAIDIGPNVPNQIVQPNYSLRDLIGNGILWAVPRNRRTVEKRWKRKYGHTDYILKILVPKMTLRVCRECGHDHEVGILCPHCYERVRKETELMQEKIQQELGLNPVDQEVIVLYDGEKKEQPDEYWKGKRIVEMYKPRPMWFSNNLLQKTTQPPATTKEVKPNDLG